MTTETAIPETEVLIVGTGPAGASAAALLSSYNIDNMVINKFSWTARTPRAHITNQRTMEVLRDLGVEEEVMRLSSPWEYMGENTFCTSLAGEELGRINSWGTHPQRKADYELSSPTRVCDLPQNMMEPLLLRAAAPKQTKVKFDTEYLGHQQDDDGVTVDLLDRMTGQKYQVRAKYLIGADGGNSRVVSDLDLPLEGKMGVAGSMNVVFEADLSKYVAHRPSILYWVIQPGSDVGGIGMGLVRMVRPWNKWLIIWGYDLKDGPPDVTEEMATSIVHKLVGDDTIPVHIESTSIWTVNDVHATELSRGRVFCMGDAIHRHPPTNGLGSNTSIQDAFNLCWKLALVLKGQAAPSLLETYDPERAPVAKQIVKRANDSIELFNPIFKTLGLLDTQDPEQMQKNINSIKDATPEAQEQRAALKQAIDNTDVIYNAHGVELNQRYESSAIISDGTPEPVFKRDKELYHQASSRPGAHVPHAWLVKNGRRVSTLDLCGKGGFSLLTGICGEAWVEAAKKVGDSLGINIAVHIIGPGQTYDDPYGDFARLREITETGALLVRPDFMVGWRANSLTDSATEDLYAALSSILGRSDEQIHAARTDQNLDEHAGIPLKDDWL